MWAAASEVREIASPADEEFVRAALVEQEVVGVIPWSEEIRRAERRGEGVLECAGTGLLGRFEAILERLHPPAVAEKPKQP